MKLKEVMKLAGVFVDSTGYSCHCVSPAVFPKLCWKVAQRFHVGAWVRQLSHHVCKVSYSTRLLNWSG